MVSETPKPQKPIPPNPPWSPGQSGNPKGRPKGTSLTLTLRKLLDTPVPGKDITYAEAVIRRLVAEAMKGSTKAANIILERIDGKVIQQVEVTTPDPHGIESVTDEQLYAMLNRKTCE